MRALLLASALMAAASGARAEMPRIDYPGLFALHAEDVQQATPTMRILELPGPVIITDRDGVFTATDQSAWGAAGCAVDRVFDIAAGVQLCPDVLDDEARGALARLVVRAGVFYAANTFPPVPRDAVGVMIAGALAARAAELDGSICTVPDAPWRGFAGYLALPQGQARISKVLGQPRLPVKHPCP